MSFSLSKTLGMKENPLTKAISHGAGFVTGGAVNTEGGGWAQGGTLMSGITGQGQPEDPAALAKANQAKLKSAAAKGQTAGEAKGDTLYGQDQATTGQKIQKGAALYEDRLNGTDPITEALKQQKQQSQATTARQFAGRGVAGGVAAAGMEQAGRQKDIDIAASAYQQNAQNLKDYTNLNSNIAANQGMLENVYKQNEIAATQIKQPEQQKGLLGSLFG